MAHPRAPFADDNGGSRTIIERLNEDSNPGGLPQPRSDWAGVLAGNSSGIFGCRRQWEFGGVNLHARSNAPHIAQEDLADLATRATVPRPLSWHFPIGLHCPSPTT
jgi:hypothetical protein